MQSNPPHKRRIALLYIGLAAALGTVILFVGSAGHDVDAQPAIAGGYDVQGAARCIGPRLDVKQSGQFVSIASSGGVTGKLRLEDGRLSGDVTCRDGSQAPLRATLTDAGALHGTIGDRRVTAQLLRDPPAPGARSRTPGAIAGDYKLSPRSDCLGSGFALESRGANRLELTGAGAAGDLTYSNGRIAGEATCAEGTRLRIEGEATNRKLQLTAGPERLVADRQREFGHLLAALFIAIAIVMLAARPLGAAVASWASRASWARCSPASRSGRRSSAPRARACRRRCSPTDVIPYVGVAAQPRARLLHVPRRPGGRPRASCGAAWRRPRRSPTRASRCRSCWASPSRCRLRARRADTKFAGFALFMGVSMSITAFPVLARILVERRMLKRPVGALVLASAAIDDVTAWFLIALASAVARPAAAADGHSGRSPWPIAFCLVMAFAVRPLLARVSTAFDEAGRVPGGWIARSSPACSCRPTRPRRSGSR